MPTQPQSLIAEIEAVQQLGRDIVPIWQQEDQTPGVAAEVVSHIATMVGNFHEVYASMEADDDNAIHQAAAYIEGVYAEVSQAADDNWDGYPDDFIGPTGYIAF